MTKGCPCPKCGKRLSACVDSRVTSDGRRRRRVCSNKKCQHRWTTWEFNEEFVKEMQAAAITLAKIKSLF
jgi:transcriptional regulator NrdR family protein